MPNSELGNLVALLSSSVKALEDIYAKNGSTFPSLNGKYEPAPLDDDQTVIDAANIAVAAAAQIIATVRSPQMTLREMATSTYTSALLGFVVDKNVPDILNEGGPQGVHAKDIAAKTKTDTSQLARVMRYLATRHFFTEVAPDVFTNNRVSYAAVKEGGRSVDELFEKPLNKYDNCGSAAFVGHSCDEGLKGSAYIPDFLSSPEATNGSTVAPFNLGLKTKASVWKWFEEEGNDWRLRRFMGVMIRDGMLFKPEVFVEAIDWSVLPKDSVVVDVGGNMGHVTMMIHKAFPHLKYIVQDRQDVVNNAEGFWKAQSPESLSSGQVTLQGHDFFQLNPVRSAAVYFMRFILHDWADPECKVILKNIRDAAGPASKLILFEFSVPYACEDPHGPIANTGAKPAPKPLLANFGLGEGGYYTMVDIQMLNLCNGQERTVRGYDDLGKATGWKLEAMQFGKPSRFVFTAV